MRKIANSILAKMNHIPKPLLHVSLVVFAVGVYTGLLVALKWWAYPGWTWRGYLTDIKALVSLLLFATPFLFWLWRLYHNRSAQESATAMVRNEIFSTRLPIIALSLFTLLLSIAAALIIVGERSIAPAILQYIHNSNWTHAKEQLEVLSKDPVRAEILETFRMYVSVHELTERNLLMESRSLREDRDKVKKLLDAGYDYNLLNSLSYAELSKGIHFLEGSSGGEKSLNDGIQLLLNRVMMVRNQMDQAVLLSRIGELELAAKNYARARMYFQMAIDKESRPTLSARIVANLGNTYASLADFGQAAKLYADAEQHYPEGRRAVFYSNFGYILLLSKDFHKAKMKVEQALRVDPKDWYSYLNLGLIKEALGNHQDAIKDFRKVIEKSENPIVKREALILAGRCLELLKGSSSEYLSLYLEADGRSVSASQINHLKKDRVELANLYRTMARLLNDAETHAIEEYVKWFSNRANALAN